MKTKRCVMVEDCERQAVLRARRRIQALNALTMLGVVTWASLAMAGELSRFSKSLSYWTLVPILLLVLAVLATHREQFRRAALLLFVGGLLTFPIGACSIAGAIVAIRASISKSKCGTSRTVCLTCGYDLRGTPFPRCPECGCLVGFTKTAEELGLERDEVSWESGQSVE